MPRGRRAARCPPAAPATCRCSTGREGCATRRRRPSWPCDPRWSETAPRDLRVRRKGLGGMVEVIRFTRSPLAFESTLRGVTALLDRSCIEATGPDAGVLLQSLLSNDVDGARPGRGVYALLLTPKARVIFDVELFNTGHGYVLACPPDRAQLVLESILRARFRRKVELAPSAHAVVWGEAAGALAPRGEAGVGGGPADALASRKTPAGPHRLLASAPDGLEPADAWEVARVEAGLPAFGREFGEDSMPAEAGLVPLAVSFTKGCYPGQEPVARLQYRGHANRGLRGLALSGALPEPGAAVLHGGRDGGRVGSAVLSPRFGPISLAILRREVSEGDEVTVAGSAARVRSLPFAA